MHKNTTPEEVTLSLKRQELKAIAQSYVHLDAKFIQYDSAMYFVMGEYYRDHLRKLVNDIGTENGLSKASKERVKTHLKKMDDVCVDYPVELIETIFQNHCLKENVIDRHSLAILDKKIAEYTIKLEELKEEWEVIAETLPVLQAYVAERKQDLIIFSDRMLELHGTNNGEIIQETIHYYHKTWAQPLPDAIVEKKQKELKKLAKGYINQSVQMKYYKVQKALDYVDDGEWYRVMLNQLRDKGSLGEKEEHEAFIHRLFPNPSPLLREEVLLENPHLKEEHIKDYNYLECQQYLFQTKKQLRQEKAAWSKVEKESKALMAHLEVRKAELQKFLTELYLLQAEGDRAALEKKLQARVAEYDQKLTTRQQEAKTAVEAYLELYGKVSHYQKRKEMVKHVDKILGGEIDSISQVRVREYEEACASSMDPERCLSQKSWLRASHYQGYNLPKTEFLIEYCQKKIPKLQAIWEEVENHSEQLRQELEEVRQQILPLVETDEQQAKPAQAILTPPTLPREKLAEFESIYKDFLDKLAFARLLKQAEELVSSKSLHDEILESLQRVPVAEEKVEKAMVYLASLKRCMSKNIASLKEKINNEFPEYRAAAQGNSEQVLKASIQKLRQEIFSLIIGESDKDARWKKTKKIMFERIKEVTLALEKLAPAEEKKQIQAVPCQYQKDVPDLECIRKQVQDLLFNFEIPLGHQDYVEQKLVRVYREQYFTLVLQYRRGCEIEEMIDELKQKEEFQQFEEKASTLLQEGKMTLEIATLFKSNYQQWNQQVFSKLHSYRLSIEEEEKDLSKIDHWNRILCEHHMMALKGRISHYRDLLGIKKRDELTPLERKLEHWQKMGVIMEKIEAFLAAPSPKPAVIGGEALASEQSLVL